MLKLKTEAKRIPFGGHHYPEYGITFRAESVPGLVTKVADFRLANNIPAGNPLQDILQFYAENWPWLVKEDRESIIEDPPTQYEEWRDWIHRTWKHPQRDLINLPHAQDRWAICRDCPYNEQFKFVESKESAELMRRSYLLRRGQTVPEDIQFCSIHKVDLALFSFFPSPGPERDEQPDFCWVGKVDL